MEEWHDVEEIMTDQDLIEHDDILASYLPLWRTFVIQNMGAGSRRLPMTDNP